jgi:lantibiotic modifying enzyme
MYPTRRELIAAAFGAAAAALMKPARSWGSELTSPHLDAALETAAWLRSVAIDETAGRVWPMVPETSRDVVTNLYSGTPGVVLFHLELYAATRADVWRAEAVRGADALTASLPQSASADGAAGLYTGIAGIAFTLAETARICGTERHRAAALRAVQLLHEAARPMGQGVAWSNVNDIISGTAGTTLFLLWAARHLEHAPSRDLAVRAGHRLLENGDRVEHGIDWAMTPEFARRMPNFSHGTAGVAYTLARLHAETGERAFLDGALGGAEHIISIARTEDGAFKLRHHDGDGENLFYLSWCHGPAGTARLFHQLGHVTGDTAWPGWVRRCALGIQASGVPETRTEGFWNNVSQCCGNAGVSTFFLDLHRTGGKSADATFARRTTADLLSRATRTEGRLRWVQAEHRVRPVEVLAQTGYMQGASGLGSLLLHHHASEQGRPPAIVLPDSPFA